MDRRGGGSSLREEAEELKLIRHCQLRKSSELSKLEVIGREGSRTYVVLLWIRGCAGQLQPLLPVSQLFLPAVENIPVLYHLFL